MGRRNLEVRTRAFVSRVLFEGTRAVGVEYATRGGGGAARRRAGEVILCGGAFNSPQLLQLSGVGAADDLRALGIDVVARPARRRREPPGPPRGLHPVRRRSSRSRCSRPRPRSGAGRGSASSGCSSGAGRARRTTSRAAASSAATSEVAYPNLMFHFLPLAIRYDGTAPAGGHGYQVHVGPMYSDARGDGEDRLDRPARSIRRSGSTTSRPSRTAASGSRRSGSPGGSSTSPRSSRTATGELSPGPARHDRRGDPRLGGTRRRDGAPPVMHRADGHGR